MLKQNTGFFFMSKQQIKTYKNDERTARRQLFAPGSKYVFIQ